MKTSHSPVQEKVKSDLAFLALKERKRRNGSTTSLALALSDLQLSLFSPDSDKMGKAFCVIFPKVLTKNDAVSFNQKPFISY